jgi:hypothetical protein
VEQSRCLSMCASWQRRIRTSRLACTQGSFATTSTIV